ncbi:MAG: cytochrome c [Acidimicrobiia bacterium]|nr:cytochrome c [Acidimicrobiia bacterium]
MRKLLIAALLGIIALTAACGGGGDDEAATTKPDSGTETDGGDSGGGDADAGETIYTSTCAACHGPDATGISGLGKDLTTSQVVADSSDAELVALVTKGRPSTDPANTTGVDMPPKGGNPSLSDEDVENVVAYIKSLNTGGGGAETTTSAP